MEQELLSSDHFLWQGQRYVVRIYQYRDGKARCSHVAETVLGPDDVVVSDGCSAEEVLRKQQAILPLAIMSRSIVAGSRALKGDVTSDGSGGFQPGKSLPEPGDR